MAHSSSSTYVLSASQAHLFLALLFMDVRRLCFSIMKLPVPPLTEVVAASEEVVLVGAVTAGRIGSLGDMTGNIAVGMFVPPSLLVHPQTSIGCKHE